MEDIGIITRDRVRDALRRLAEDQSAESTPLVGMSAIRRSLERAGFQPSRESCSFEFGRLVTEIAESELAALRRRCGLGARSAGDPWSQIVADFQPGHHDLEAWSAAYYLYLRPDLGIDLPALTEMLRGRHRRTLQRRLRRGIEALTARLRALEHSAVCEARRERLAARLPAPPPRPLLGLDALIDRLSRLVADPAHPSPIALGGPGGIGKTAVARMLAVRCVEQGGCDEVIWLAGATGGTGEASEGAGGVPETVAPEWSIRCQLTASLDEAVSGDRLRTSLVRRRCLIVADGLDDVRQAAATAGFLVDVAPLARIVLTGRAGWSACPGVQALSVPTLAPPLAEEMLRQEARARGLDDVARARPQTVLPLVEATAGHPLAIRLAVGQLRVAGMRDVADAFANGHGVAGALYRDLWERAWRQVDAEVRATVRAVMSGRAGDAAPDPLRRAVDAGLLLPAGDPHRRRFRTPLFLRRFVAAQDRHAHD